MTIAIITRDRPGSLETRKANRDAHLAYVKDSGMVLFGGPFMDDQGQMNGSMIILDTDDMDTARAWAKADPYVKADLFEDVDMRHWKQVIG